MSRTLALDGGTPAFPQGPPSWPPESPQVRAAVDAALTDGRWGKYHGGSVEALAEQLTHQFAVPEALPCCSGTMAIELGLRGLKIGPGDEVLLAGYDFPGNFRCIEAVGATPVLVDVDPRSSSLDPDQIVAASSDATRAVLVSHLHGGLVSMNDVKDAAEQAGLLVIEDACQNPGAIVCGRPAGSQGDVGVLSFGGSKLLTAGRGGAVLTSDPAVAQRIRVFRDRGNDTFPLSELQAVVLLPQLVELEKQNERRNSAVTFLFETLAGIESLQPIHGVPTDSTPAYYKVGWLVSADDATLLRFVAAVQAEGIAMDRGFRGFVKRSRRRCRKVGELPHATAASERTVILHHPVLLSESAVIEKLAATIRDVAESVL